MTSAGEPMQQGRPPRRSFAQWCMTPVRWIVASLMEPHHPIALIGALTAVSAAGLGVGAWLIGAIDPPLSQGAVKIEHPAIVTCAEQQLARASFPLFAQGVVSTAPRPWLSTPSSGVFHFAREDIGDRVAATVSDMRDGSLSPEVAEADLERADRDYKHAWFANDAADRVVIEYHRGVANLGFGDAPNAVAHFNAAGKRLQDALAASHPSDPAKRTAVSIANTQGLGHALLKTDPAKAAATFEGALSLAVANSRILAEPEMNKDLLFKFRRNLMVDVDMADLYADAIAAQIQVLAASPCHDIATNTDPNYTAARTALSKHVATFRGGVPDPAAYPLLAADLQIAGALVGDASFVRSFPDPPRDASAASGAMVAARSMVRSAMVGASGVDGTGQPAADDPADDVWAKLSQWRGDFARGNVDTLRSDFAGLPNDDRRDRLSQFRSEIIGSAMKDAPHSAQGALWRSYHDMVAGGQHFAMWALQAPFGLILGGLLDLLILAAVIVLWMSAFRVRWIYQRLYVSAHARNRSETTG